jgi:hypothetical protein
LPASKKVILRPISFYNNSDIRGMMRFALRRMITVTEYRAMSCYEDYLVKTVVVLPPQDNNTKCGREVR